MTKKQGAREIPIFRIKNKKGTFWTSAETPEDMVRKLAAWEEANPGANIFDFTYTYKDNAEKGRVKVDRNWVHDWLCGTFVTQPTS